MENPISSQPRLLVLAPTRRAVSETFIRANLQGLPFDVTAFFGDERPLKSPWRLVYGLAILLSKVCTRLRWLRFFFQAEDGIRFGSPSRGLGDVYKRQMQHYFVLNSVRTR